MASQCSAATRRRSTRALDGGLTVTTEPWQVLTMAPNIPVAHAIESLLAGEGVECRLKSETTLLGELQPCAVLVEASFMHRAQFVLSAADFSDAELDFLATGALSCDAAKEEHEGK